MANLTVTRTYVCSIQNHRQVSDGLDSLGDSASKIWNVARWTADRIWDATGEIPNGSVLKSYMKNQSCWKDLNNPISQKVIEELSDAFQSWFDLRHKFDEANPPGYRKTATNDHVPRSRSKQTASNTTPETTAFDSAKGRTSKNTSRTSFSASTRLVPTLTSRKSIRCRTFEPSGMVMNGNYTSSARSISKQTIQ